MSSYSVLLGIAIPRERDFRGLKSNGLMEEVILLWD